MDEDRDRYEVVLTDSAVRSYMSISSSASLARVNRTLSILDTVPYLGHPYDPIYEAAKPPFDVLVTYAGRIGIYYVVVEEKRQVRIYYLEDQRQDPKRRFGS